MPATMDNRPIRQLLRAASGMRAKTRVTDLMAARVVTAVRKTGPGAVCKGVHSRRQKAL